MDVPCRLWYIYGALRIRDTSTVADADLRMAVPLATDIKKGDVVREVKDRLGADLWSDLKVDVVLRRKNHLECRVAEHG